MLTPICIRLKMYETFFHINLCVCVCIISEIYQVLKTEGVF